MTRERGEATASLRSLRYRAATSRYGWLSAIRELAVAVAYILAAGLLAAVALLDGAIDPRFPVTPLYLLPVALVAWRLGVLSGLLWAGVAAAVWVTVDISEVPLRPPADLAWLAGVRFVTFAILAIVVAALRQEREMVRTLAGTDILTGVQNAPAFRDLLDRERSRALRYNRPFTLAYLDIDGFRVINEEYGHTAGDQALRLMAATMEENIRSMDTVARMGGDEFALLFPETGKGGAEIVLGKIQTRLTEAAGGRSLPLTVTIGGVICVGAPESVDDLIRHAESLMYAAKRDGGAGVRTKVLDENFGIEAILQRS